MVVTELRTPTVTRGAVTAAAVSAGFGTAWSLWGASGLVGDTKFAVGAVGVVLGVLVVLGALHARRRATEDEESVLRSRPYRLIVMLEFAALVIGSVALGSTGHNEYVPVWYAAVVGVHFVAFGRAFWTGFHAIGAALLAAAAAGLVVGLAGGTRGAIVATTGLSAATVLLGAGAFIVVNAHQSTKG